MSGIEPTRIYRQYQGENRHNITHVVLGVNMNASRVLAVREC